DKNGRRELKANNVHLIKRITGLKDIDDLVVISPIHCPLQKQDYIKSINKNIKFYTHHEAVNLILKDWKRRMDKKPVIEITGVKGKTTTCFILKEILDNSLILSSLGAYLFKEDKEILLKKNISITPANIIETIDMARKIAQPKCSFENDGNSSKEYINYDNAIFESSLGACGIGDIGILTNILENYPIAKGKSNAQIAKKQIFNCRKVVIEKNTLEEFYPEFKNSDKVISFSLNSDSNVKAKNIKYSLDETSFTVEYELDTTNNENIKGQFNVKSFAPSPYHVLNILGSITTCLVLDIDIKRIQDGLLKFNGIPGRSSIKKIENSTIIEEINPGINTKAIEKSINMIKDDLSYNIIIGGKYGITCEEIDEDKLIKLLSSKIKENPSLKITLCDELGNSIYGKINNFNGIKYIEKLDDSIKESINENKNILLVYRSNYKQVLKR
ncbi:MAG: coenzyme F430 synthase, partial [Methanobrevibacter sp.]